MPPMSWTFPTLSAQALRDWLKRRASANMAIYIYHGNDTIHRRSGQRLPEKIGLRKCSPIKDGLKEHEGGRQLTTHHIRHISNVPFLERLIEGSCSPKRANHAFNV
mmetsp:Transcript_4270/g.9602  ORF Transcript_4270/g.9602 Transcript_4270/m.9602 type:complete len:106 (-) Transcript_4270:585-902(-)